MINQYDIEALVDANIKQSNLIAEINAVFAPKMGCVSPNDNSSLEQLDKIKKLIHEHEQNI